MRPRPLLLLALTAMLALAGACGDSRPAQTTGGVAAYDLQGHRGARGLRPENTLPAFEEALDLEVDTLELDLHFTADGELVVWHDPIIDAAKCGLAPGAPAGSADPDDPATPDSALMIANLALAELGAYRCDRNPEPDRFPIQEAAATLLAGDRYEIVTLAEVLDFVDLYSQSGGKEEAQRDAAARVKFNVETKRRPDAPENIGDGFDGTSAGPFERAITDLVDEREIADRMIVQSFDHRSLWAIRRLRDDIALAALTRRGDTPDLDDLFGRGATIWSPDYRALDAGSLVRAHDAGLQVVPWTVNDPQDMQRLVDLGVDGLITDRPDLAPSRP